MRPAHKQKNPTISNVKSLDLWSALCFPSRTLPSPSFLLIFFLPVPSPINPFSPAHCTASPKTAPRTVCRSVGSLPAVAHVPGLCSMRSVRLDESCSEWLSSSSDIVLTVAHILPLLYSLQPVLLLIDPGQRIPQNAISSHITGDPQRAQDVGRPECKVGRFSRSHFLHILPRPL